MKYLILAFAVLLTGCVTAPVVMKFPEAPEALMQKCEELEKVPANTKQLSTTSEVVVRNYASIMFVVLK
jgi:starvation-inducible outer membrane lipoprotein